jgi:hypothetical protein
LFDLRDSGGVPLFDDFGQGGFGARTRTGASILNSLSIGSDANKHLAVYAFDSTTIYLKLDGSTATTVGKDTTALNDLDRIGIRCNGVAVGTNAYSGKTGEFIMLDGYAVSTDIEYLEGYLAHKWGLEASLPGGHPYKSSPP